MDKKIKCTNKDFKKLVSTLPTVNDFHPKDILSAWDVLETYMLDVLIQLVEIEDRNDPRTINIHLKENAQEPDLLEILGILHKIGSDTLVGSSTPKGYIIHMWWD